MKTNIDIAYHITQMITFIPYSINKIRIFFDNIEQLIFSVR